MSSARDPIKPVLWLLLATACWGFSFPGMKALLMAQAARAPHATEWFLVSQTMVVRFGLAAVVMLAICGRSLRRLTRLDVKLGVGLGLFAGVATLVQVAGLNYTLASTSAFLTAFYVLLIPVTLAVWHRRWPSLLVWVSCGLVIAGMGTLCGVDWRAFRLGKGEWMTLLSSALFMGQILWLDRPEFAGAEKGLATFVMLATMSLGFVPMALLTAQSPRDLIAVNASWPVAGLIVALVTISAVAAFYIMNVWQPRIHPTHAGLVYCAEPVFASIYALFLPAWLSRWMGIAYPDEQLTMNLWIGGALVTAANVLIQFVPKEKEG